MPKRWSSDAVVTLLRQNGFILVSQRGSHQKYSNALGTVVIVPATRKEIPQGTLASIIRQSSLPRHYFN